MAGGTIQLVTKGKPKRGRKKAIKATPFKMVVKRAPTKSILGGRGLNAQERKEIKKMIDNKKEVYYIPAISYAVGRSVATTFKQAQISNLGCFGHSTSGSVSCCGLTVGNYLGGISDKINEMGTIMHPTGGIKLNGDTANPLPIQGDKAHMKSMRLNLRISALRVETVAADAVAIRPLAFRVIHFKIKPERPANLVPNLKTGTTDVPSLFLDNDNKNIGLNDFVVPFDIDSLRVNTQNIEVFKDIKFQLMTPVAAASTSPGTDGYAIINNQQNLPTVKDLSFYLPVPKKPVKYDSSKTPTNWDYRSYVIVICHRTGGSYTQSQGYWDLESNMCSKVQEF